MRAKQILPEVPANIVGIDIERFNSMIKCVDEESSLYHKIPRVR